MEKLTRQDAIKAIVLPAFAAAIGVTTTKADAKSSKGAVKYQDKPKGSQKCAGCKFFIRGKTAKSMGGCQIVDGSISPNGWCVAYTKK
jgi:hypothetical protein